jgi:hypothetical protein
MDHHQQKQKNYVFCLGKAEIDLIPVGDDNEKKQAKKNNAGAQSREERQIDLRSDKLKNHVYDY